jgi:hypothetical protein
MTRFRIKDPVAANLVILFKDHNFKPIFNTVLRSSNATWASTNNANSRTHNSIIAQFAI